MQSYIAYTYHWVNLSRLTAQFRREKWFNIGSNRSIVIRYRFDSQFHCSYLESRGVPGKTREIPVQKRGKLSPFHFRFAISSSGDVISSDVISGDVISGDATSGDVISSDATSGDVTAPPQMINGWCLYTTNEPENMRVKNKIKAYMALQLLGNWVCFTFMLSVFGYFYIFAKN